MSEQSAIGSLIAERYYVEASLGVGGMGAVFRVRDQLSGRTLALKQLHLPDGAQAQLLRSQFEREYHTLVQLRHPSIIEAYDYGLDANGHAFYTMELLDGQDLRERPPPDYRQACALLRDVASSLAIMHSRRLLHRDISARNIRCTSSGRAKLIDFGAMAPMGVLKTVVGTPPFVPPEALQLQALDGRSDLFALGAVFYWVLTRRQAYPARNFSELPQRWATPIASPRQCDVDLPPALDQLIMQLLELDRNARPSSAAEVIERLCGIAALPHEELPSVSAAYLTAPTLIGRDAPLVRVRERLVAASKGTGGALLIAGAPGSGRSRMVDACVLEAKLLGGLVLRADPSDAAAGDYGVARSLILQLEAAAPRLVGRHPQRDTQVLAHILPELAQRERLPAPVGASQPALLSAPPSLRAGASVEPPGRSSRDPGGLGDATVSEAPTSGKPERSKLQTALRDLLRRAARERLIVVAIDDADAIDEPSAALLATLAHASARRKLVVIAAALEQEQPGPLSAALSLLRQVAQTLPLSALSAAQTESLLRSVFGDVPNVAAISECVHRNAGGNPRWTVELAEHLVSRGIARYAAGSWALPAAIAASDLPGSLHERVLSQLSALSKDACELVETLALTEPRLLPVAEYPRLTEHGDRARTFHALSDLLASGILVASGDRNRFGQGEVATFLRDHISPEREPQLHERIAAVLQGSEHLEELAEHKLRAGKQREGIAATLALCMDPSRAGPSSQMARLIELALACAERSAAPPRVRAVLRCRMLFTCSMRGDVPRFAALLPLVRECVLRYSGLADYAALGEGEPAQRARRALEQARARHDATPEAERVFAPEEACGFLAGVWGACAYMAAVAWDIGFVEDLPRAGAFAQVMPSLRYVDFIVDGQRAMQSGRSSIAAEVAEAMIREYDKPEYADLTPMDRTARRAPFIYTLGIYAALSGKATALDYVKELDQPLFRSNAWRMRMVYELMHGRSEAAAACQRRAELLGLQDSGAAGLPGTTLRIELLASAYGDDVVAVKRCMERIDAMCATHPGWRPALAIARAHYRRLQGDPSGALVHAEEALRLAPAGRHLNWSLAATTQLDLLNELDRGSQAATLGEQYLATAARENIESAKPLLLRSLAESYLRIGRFSEALRMADAHLESHLAFGTEGLLLGLAYETRARVAIAMRDEAAVLKYAALCAAEYKGSRNALLRRKYQQLMKQADEAGVPLETMQQRAAEYTAASRGGEVMQTLHSQLLSAMNDGERASRALQLLLEAHGVREGYLFQPTPSGLALSARAAAHEPSVDLVHALEHFAATAALSAAADPSDENDDDATRMSEIGAEFGDSPPDAGADGMTSAFEPDPHPDTVMGDFEPLPLVARRGDRRVLVAIAALRVDGPMRAGLASDVLSAFAEALLADHSA